MREPVKISEFASRRAVATRAQVKPEPIRTSTRQIRPQARMLDGMSAPIAPIFTLEKPRVVKPVEVEPTSESMDINISEKIVLKKPITTIETEKKVLEQAPIVKEEPKLQSQFEHNKSDRKSRFSKPQLALFIASFLVFSLGIYASISSLKTNHKVEAQTQQLSKSQPAADENDGDHPDETDPGQQGVNSYKVDPTLPRRIIISKIGVNARVKPLGTKSSNELKAPNNIFDAGWYQGSAKPGGNGAMLIDGHVHGPTKKGVFYNLPKLVPGDIISVERGDGTIFKYGVVKTQKFDKNSVDMASAITPVEPGVPGLNLITCTGSLDSASSTYNERILVYTSQIL